mgnify:CR=1 FL=1
MQKVINVLAVLSFLGTASIVGGGAYVYLNRDSLIESAKEAATKAATEAVTSALPGLMEGLMPDIPEVTGGAIPMGQSAPKETGLPLPSTLNYLNTP